MYKIGLDIMGGDNSPHAHIAAAKDFSKQNSDVVLYLFGNEEYKKEFDSFENIEYVVTTEKIYTEEEPVKAIRKKKDSSLVVGINYAVENKIDCIISSGSTGAIVAGGVFIAKRIKGIDRPALPLFLPSTTKSTPKCFLDVGATIDTKPKHMVQHALIAKIYLESVFNVKNPTVSLLNIGEEESKGTEVYKETYKLLQESSMNFIGNVEPREIITSENDVIVADGFTGNVVLKTLEGTMQFMSAMIKTVFYKNFLNKIAGLITKKSFDAEKKNFDYKEIGATPVLGVKSLILKAHGSSNEKALFSALNKAKEIIDSNYIEKLEDYIASEENND